MTKFVIEPAKNDYVISEVAGSVQEIFNNKVIIEPCAPILGLELGAISSLAAAIISGIALCLQLEDHRYKRKTTNPWTHERLMSVVNTEMLKHGITNVTIVEIKNFDALTKVSKQPCRLRVATDNSRNIITLYIFNDESVYTISEASNTYPASEC